MTSHVMSCLLVLLICAPLRSSDWLTYRECAISNAESIRQFDVLFVVEHFNSDDEKRIKRKTRLALDFDLNQCVCFDVQEFEDGSIPGQPKVITLSKVLIFDAKSGVSRRFPEGVSDNVDNLFLTLGASLKVADLRCVGLGRFPETFTFGQQLGCFDRCVRDRAIFPQSSKDVGMRESVLQNRNYVRVLFTNDKIEQRYDFDGKTSMPTAISTYVGAINQRQHFSEQSFSWKEMDGLHLPVSVSVNSVKKRGDLGIVVREEFQSAQMHWFTVNQPLDKELLNVGRQGGLPMLMKLVDPAASGADTLLK